jgi:hypothetical protein
LSAERSAYIASEAGLKEACVLSCPAISKYWDEMIKVSENTDQLIKGWQCAMAVKEIKPEDLAAVETVEVASPLA